MAVSSPRPDAWSRWFFRLVQTVGLLLFAHEALGPGRAPVMLFSAGLILGAVGIKALLHAIVDLAEAASKEDS